MQVVAQGNQEIHIWSCCVAIDYTGGKREKERRKEDWGRNSAKALTMCSAAMCSAINSDMY